MLNREQFDELAGVRQQGCTSIYMPTHRRGREEVRKGPIRLGNLLREAEERAVEQGLAAKTARQALEGVRPLLNDGHFWEHQGDGLAVFVVDGDVRTHRLPYPVDELVVVGERFCVRPLLPFRDTGQVFYVLAVSKNSVRLFECTSEHVHELDLHDIPNSLEDVVGYDWEERSLQFHSSSSGAGGRPSTVFHGHGRNSDKDKEEIRKFLHHVDAGVSAMLRSRAGEAPLVLAMVDYIDAIYRQVSDYPRLVEQGIDGNPDAAGAAELHGKALRIVEPLLSRESNEQLARLTDMVHTSRATTDLRAVLTAARDARADTMCVVVDQPVWGRFDAASGDTEVRDERQPRDEDLLDLAVAHGLATGARVFDYRAAAALPDGARIGAILRYET